MGHVTAIGATIGRGARSGARARATALRWADDDRTRRAADDRSRPPTGSVRWSASSAAAARTSRCSRTPVAVLAELGVAAELRVVSAHRTPGPPVPLRRGGAPDAGIRVIIAGAGGAAHLPGMLAAKTILPVIGVPIPTQHLGGLDSLLSIVQMPRGIPVATVAIGNATTPGCWRRQILALGDDALGGAAGRLARPPDPGASSTTPRTRADRRRQAPATGPGGVVDAAGARPGGSPTSSTVLRPTRIATAATGAPGERRWPSRRR